MYSRKAIETALHFAAGESSRCSIHGLQFRADGSIEATDGFKLIVVPPQFEESEAKAYKKSGCRADVFVPRDVLAEILRRTKVKGRCPSVWYGVEAITTKKATNKGAIFSWGEAVERMEFDHCGKFPEIRRVTDHCPQEPTFKVCLGIDTMIETMQAAMRILETKRGEHRGGVVFEFSDADSPAFWRCGGSFGAIMPMRGDKDNEPGDYEKDFRGLTDQPEKPAQDEPEAEPDQPEPETGEETPTATAPAPEPHTAPGDGMMVVTVAYSDVYDVSPDGREYSEDTGKFRDNEEMDPEDLADLIRSYDTRPVVLADHSLLWQGEEDMFGHTMNKGMTITYSNGKPLDQADWAWLLEATGLTQTESKAA